MHFALICPETLASFYLGNESDFAIPHVHQWVKIVAKGMSTSYI